MRSSHAAFAAAISLAASAHAAQYVYTPEPARKAVGLIFDEHLTPEARQGFDYCETRLSLVHLSSVDAEGSILNGFVGVEAGKALSFRFPDFYDKFPNSERGYFRDFLRPGAVVQVLYELCDKDRYALAILSVGPVPAPPARAPRR